MVSQGVAEPPSGWIVISISTSKQANSLLKLMTLKLPVVPASMDAGTKSAGLGPPVSATGTKHPKDATSRAIATKDRIDNRRVTPKP
jgi:hypothetical protein